MAADPELRAHQEWLGFLQPVGLVVSAPALAAKGAFVDRNIVPAQQRLVALLEERSVEGERGAGVRRVLADFPRFCAEFLGWEPADLAGAPGGPLLPDALEVALPEYGERLAPSYAVLDPDAPAEAPLPSRFVLLIQEVAQGQDLDEPTATSERGWHASPQARFERLLRETRVPQGLLVNGTSLRLVYAPSGESSGYLTFVFDDLAQVAGRPLVAGLHMLLRAERLFTLPSDQRLPALLRESRRYQNEVSTKLAEQVLEALLELLRGFAAADEAAKGRLLANVVATKPDDVYGGLLATLMRLVFLLYAEDRGLMPRDPVYAQHYSVAGLFEKLRDDAGRNPDTMEQRYGAWARLLTLFRLVHEGGGHAGLHLPARRGSLFDPDAYPFLEGRAPGSRWRDAGTLDAPRVSDGVIQRVLQNLLVLDGERLSYRALDVEQIGSVYEAMMGFRLERARGASIAVRPDHVVVNLEELLAAKPAERAKRLADETACKLPAEGAVALKAAKKIDDAVAALGRRVSPHTHRALPKGALYLQPTEERRRSGAHYTPRTLTEPIVRTTLEPILGAFGQRPRAEQILDLKVCDPAMGSGAFLVEACRYLGDAVVRAWEVHGETPAIPPDEDPHLFARRLVAQRCLYGVDKNPFAVDLAKLSLWLATLARDHPFTFLDHAFRCGDSLIGLWREQITCFDWDVAGGKQMPMIQQELRRRLQTAQELRARIQALAESDDTETKTKLLADADAALDTLRRVGDLVVAAFFGAEKDKAREELRARLEGEVQRWLGGKGDPAELQVRLAALRGGEKPVLPFHWEIEFPEVFSRDNPGFDAFVGNPPFLGGHRIWPILGGAYRDFLHMIHQQSGGKAVDLVAHFFRRGFSLLRNAGTLGLLATNTIAQGDTRIAGLKFICRSSGTIYNTLRRVRWPGAAAVVVSTVHIRRGRGYEPRKLDGRIVPGLNSFLFPGKAEFDPVALRSNAGKSFRGSVVYGMGFTFDDEDSEATSVATMRDLIDKNPRNRERIFEFIGGEDLNASPTQSTQRYVINFEEMSLEEASRWPDLLSIVSEKVKPARQLLGGYSVAESRSERWWVFGTYASALHKAIPRLPRCLALSQVSAHHCVAFQPVDRVFSHALIVFPLSSYASFAVLQSRSHELWARFFGSSMKDDLRYTPSDCFETFPFPERWEASPALEETGRAYYEYRAELMVRNDEGLTKTYNRFHDPDEQSPEIIRLRELHGATDRAVLDAYGWTDLRPECKFLLDYEEEGEAAEPGTRRRKKPWRYRWPDELRDEVLARLLALNQERARAEALSGAGGGKAAPRRTKRARTTRKADPDSPGPLFE